MVEYALPLINYTPSVVLSSSEVMAHRGGTDESCARYTVDQTAGARWMDETQVIADKVFQQHRMSRGTGEGMLNQLVPRDA